MQILKDLKISTFGQLLKRHFLAGLFIVLPIGVIGWIIGSVFGLLWKLPYLLPPNLQPENMFFDHETIIQLFNFVVTVVATLTLALGISFVGWVSKQYIGRKLLDLLAEVISHIPVIRSVYSALDQLLKTLASSDGGQFSRVVYIEYPRKGLWALAFVTGPARGPNIPTTPNPTSGFHLLVPESDVRESHLSVEEAFKTILSLGLAQSEPVRPGSR
jgi:uncharacterized membrane protein